MFNKENFIEASFVDNERQNIEILARGEDGKTVIPTVIPYDENNDMFKELMNIKTLDELHEDTHNKKKLESQLYREQAIEFAKESGLVTAEGLQFEEGKIVQGFFKYLIKDPENEDAIFALKLELFEIDEIKNSEDIETKKSIRQAKNKNEIILNALKIMTKE
tara:strand:+ start:1256 stop:1744 length:489 start_codon:yes stop_codon:yes gene_type:complete